MIKRELVERIAAAEQLPRHQAQDALGAILDRISDALAEGARVEIRGFGAFATKRRPARSGRDPRTGEMVPVDEKIAISFRTGREMRERLNPGQ